MSMAQLGYQVRTNMLKQIRDLQFPPNQGGSGGSGAGTGGSGGAFNEPSILGPENINPSKHFDDALFQQAIDSALRDDISILKTLGNEYSDLINQLMNTYSSISSAPQVNVQEMISLFLNIQSVIAASSIANPAPLDPIGNVINRVEGSENGALNVDVQHVENPVNIEGGNRLNVDFLDNSPFVRVLDPNHTLDYLRNFLTLDTYRLMQENMTRTLRVMTLLVDFNNLHTRSQSIAGSLSNNFNNYMMRFLYTFGSRGVLSLINRLFNPRTMASLVTWETLYTVYNEEYERALWAAGVDDNHINHEGENPSSILQEDCLSLIRHLDSRIVQGNPNYERYVYLTGYYW